MLDLVLGFSWVELGSSSTPVRAMLVCCLLHKVVEPRGFADFI